MVKKLVIFDMDGLMIDSERKTYEGYKEVLAAKNIEFSFDFFKKLLGRPIKENEKTFKNYYGQDFDFKRIVGEVHTYVHYSFEKEGVPIKEGLISLLEYLSGTGCRLAVATSSDKIRVDAILNSANLSKFFDFYICGDEVKHGKPHPEVFLTCCEKAQVDKENAMVLEDSEMGISAAYHAGITCIAVPDMVKPGISFQDKAYIVVDSLNDVLTIVKDTKQFQFSR